MGTFLRIFSSRETPYVVDDDIVDKDIVDSDVVDDVAVEDVAVDDVSVDDVAVYDAAVDDVASFLPSFLGLGIQRSEIMRSEIMTGRRIRDHGSFKMT